MLNRCLMLHHYTATVQQKATLLSLMVSHGRLEYGHVHSMSLVVVVSGMQLTIA